MEGTEIVVLEDPLDAVAQQNEVDHLVQADLPKDRVLTSRLRSRLMATPLNLPGKLFKESTFKHDRIFPQNDFKKRVYLRSLELSNIKVYHRYYICNA